MKIDILKSIGAVLAGFIAVFVLSIVTDVILELTHVFPPQSDPTAYTQWMLLLALVYRTIYGGVGGYVAAALAPDRRLGHAITLGSIGLVFAALGTLANLDKTTPSTLWYPILLIVFTLPSVWFGGKLRADRR